MAAISVQQSGGDFSTLAAALADASTGAGDTITISGTWSVLDTAECTVADDTITITADPTDSRVTTARHVAASPNHYRLHTPVSGDGEHCFTVNNTGCTIDGLDIRQNGEGDSVEGIRMTADGGTLTVSNCIGWTNNDTHEDQDFLYLSNISATINVINTKIYGFTRAGIHISLGSGSHTVTLNVNSCGIWNCGENAEAMASGIMAYGNGAPSTHTVNIHNTWVIDCNWNQSDSDDYAERGGAGATYTWNISNSIDSDNSIAGRIDTGGNNLANRVIRDSTAGGDEVLVNDISDSAPFDLSLIDDSTNNDAQERHNDSEAHGLTITNNDIDGTSRNSGGSPVQGSYYDVGAFEVIVAAGILVPIIWHHLNKNIGR